MKNARNLGVYVGAALMWLPQIILGYYVVTKLPLIALMMYAYSTVLLSAHFSNALDAATKERQ